MDILAMTSEPTFTGCMIETRPIGLFHMSDEKGRDEKILSVPSVDPHFNDVKELDHVAPISYAKWIIFSGSTKILSGKWSTRRRGREEEVY